MIIGFDCETHLIRPGLLAPPMVCYTESAEGEPGGRLYHARFDKHAIIDHLARLLSEDHTFVGANTAYDVAVLMAWEPALTPLFFEAYHQGRVEDVQINQKLIDLSYGRLAQSGYSLADIVQRRLHKDRHAEKNDPGAWRLRYVELDDVPPAEWPEAASGYAVEDAVDARDVLLSQRAEAPRYQHQAAEQARASLALHLLSVEGVYTDRDTIEALKELTVQRFRDLTDSLIAEGLVRSTKAGPTRNTKKARERLINAYLDAGIPIPLTDTGETIAKARIEAQGLADVTLLDVLAPEEIEKYTSLDKVACDGSGDPVMKDYARYTSLKGIVDTHIPDLERGMWPGTPIQAYFNPLLETGRISCSKGRGGLTHGFQLTNPARGLEVLCPACRGAGCGACKEKGEVPSDVDIRTCFVAEPGYAYGDGDFPGLELSTVAQACKIIVGYSRLGEALKAGIDVHLSLGARLLGISYEEAVRRKHDRDVKKARQTAKPGNFGFWGGMGPAGFRAFALGYDVHLTLEEAANLKQLWREEYPEQAQYFAYISELCSLGGGAAEVVQLFSGRIRGRAPFCAAANSFFQGLGADAAKDALWAVTRACYDPTLGSVLFGARPWNFVHDQILAKIPDVRDDSIEERKLRHDRVMEMGRLMTESANVYLPDFPLEVKPHLSYAWQKNGEPVFDRDGLIMPWDLARALRAECWYGDGSEVVWW